MADQGEIKDLLLRAFQKNPTPRHEFSAPLGLFHGVN